MFSASSRREAHTPAGRGPIRGRHVMEARGSLGVDGGGGAPVVVVRDEKVRRDKGRRRARGRGVFHRARRSKLTVHPTCFFFPARGVVWWGGGGRRWVTALEINLR